MARFGSWVMVEPKFVKNTKVESLISRSLGGTLKLTTREQSWILFFSSDQFWSQPSHTKTCHTKPKHFKPIFRPFWPIFWSKVKKNHFFRNLQRFCQLFLVWGCTCGLKFIDGLLDSFFGTWSCLRAGVLCAATFYIQSDYVIKALNQ